MILSCSSNFLLKTHFTPTTVLSSGKVTSF